MNSCIEIDLFLYRKNPQSHLTSALARVELERRVIQPRGPPVDVLLTQRRPPDQTTPDRSVLGVPGTQEDIAQPRARHLDPEPPLLVLEHDLRHAQR